MNFSFSSVVVSVLRIYSVRGLDYGHYFHNRRSERIDARFSLFFSSEFLHSHHKLYNIIISSLITDVSLVAKANIPL